MEHAAYVATAVAAFTGVAARLVPRRLRPEAAARLMTALVLLSFAAAVWTLVLIVTSNVAQLHGVAERLAWCAGTVASHRGSFSPLGIVALAAAMAALLSTVRVRVRQRRQRAPSDAEDLAVIDAEQPVAYSLPGRPGQVVVSTGMLRSLDARERRVLLAHERSHLRRGHHRYVRLTELAAAAVPILTPLNRRVRFAVERWADEDAAAEVGDRAVVASAIARAALAAQGSAQFGLAMADEGVLERVDIMLSEPAGRSRLVEASLGMAVLTGFFGLFASALLMEPWVAAVLGLCH